MYDHLHPWRHLALATAVTATVALAAFSAASIGLQTLGARVGGEPRIAPILDPTRLPRIAFENLVYEGAFRLPAEEVQGDSFSLGGGPLAFNSANNSLFVGTRMGNVAEVTIPSPVNSADVAALPFAKFLQPFADPAAGRLKDVGPDANLAGLLVHERRLIGTGLIYYDANNTQLVSHFSRPLSLAEPAPIRMHSVGERGRSGFVAGYMAAVPPEWQSALGGPAITGQCCVPIISRTSWGPSAFAFNPDELDRADRTAARALLYYDSEHPTLGKFDGSGPAFGGTTMVGGVAVISGSSTALFVGSNGTGPFCYGNGTADQSLANTVGPDGARFCFDPTTSDKGQHAYPYRYQMWAYDLNDWAKVRAGREEPWRVEPYGVWNFNLPTPEAGTRIIGVAFDPQRRRLFIAQRHADRDGYASRALIHVYNIQ